MTAIGPVEFLVFTTNNRLRKPTHHVDSRQVRATLEELAHLLDASLEKKDLNAIDAYSIVNCIRLLARTPSDCFEVQSPG